jgi:probable 2-oxoglutarate dehydrogenase E1 component DHKTD1
MSVFYNLIRGKTLQTFNKSNGFISKICLNYHTIEGVYGFKPRLNPIRTDVEKGAINQRSHNQNIFNLVNAFRSRGHLLSRLDPLDLNKPESYDALELDLSYYENDNSLIDAKGIVNIDQTNCKVSEIVKFLVQTYCGNISIEFMHLSDANERDWIANKWESLITKHSFSIDEKKKLAQDLLKSELFDNFLTKKFSTVKRYGGEGAETMISFFDEIFRSSCEEYNISDIIIGMPHRGRLNLLANLLNYPPVIMFQKMLGKPEFDLSQANGATGDVLSHLFTSTDLKYGDKAIHISLLPNPSHLEAISPVVCGKARGKAMTKNVSPYDNSNRFSPILGIQVHGDGAFSGQGIIMETLAMANVPHYSVDGSIHLIVNNQISYTTPGLTAHGRSTRYCSDVVKAIEAPCIHVNGEDPQSVVKAAKIALEYRQTFGKDIAIDLVCYRQWGHNELDDPTFTNPLMYSNINSRDLTIPQKYANNILNSEEKELIVKEYNSYLNNHFQDINNYKAVNNNLKGVWSGITYASSHSLSQWDTSVDADLLCYICAKSIEFPNNFNIHSTLNKVFNDRLNRVKEGIRIDWATAEALAFGSLLYQDFNVRISGQDVGRGIISQLFDLSNKIM